MEIVIENANSQHLNLVRLVLGITDVKVEKRWVELGRIGDSLADELRTVIVFQLPNLDDAMNTLTHVFEGTQCNFFASELGMRWTIA